MKKLPLSQGLFSVVNNEDWERLSTFKWCATKNGTKWYAKRRAVVDGKQTSVYLHKEVLRIKDSTVLVDHKDGDGLNNRRRNLRISTKSANAWNSRPQAGSSSKYKGVSLTANVSASGRKWHSYAKFDGRKVNLGYFYTEIEAAKAYDKAVRSRIGAGALLNAALFPQDF